MTNTNTAKALDNGYAIEVHDVHKKFKIYYDKGHTLKEKLLFRKRNRSEERWVLRGIDFKVKKGEAIGLIGENGAGKSTMLKLMTRIIYPDQGSITMKGRVSSLIELGAGFHPDMSGRENIYTNASIFGLTRKEIDARLDDIIAFSELEQFIDNPVRTYSSGMYMRLAFAVAINVDADILLIDEILAVGDAAFQAKCFNKLREIKASGTTIVIVSHSLGQIEQICDRSIWFKDGVIEREGLPFDVHPYYLDFMGRKNQPQAQSQPEPAQDSTQESVVEQDSIEDVEPEQQEALQADPAFRWGSREAYITGVQLLDSSGQESNVFKTGESMTIHIAYKCTQPINDAVIGIGIFRNDGLQCYGVNTHIDRYGDIPLQQQGYVECVLQANRLLEGEYMLDIAIHKEDGFAYDYWRNSVGFRMYSDIADAGVVRLAHEWIVE